MRVYSFGKKKPGIDLENLLIKLQSGKLKGGIGHSGDSRKAQSMYSKFHYGLKQIGLIEDLDIAAKLVELWRNEFYNRIEAIKFHPRISKKIWDLIRVESKDYLFDLREDHKTAKRLNNS